MGSWFRGWRVDLETVPDRCHAKRIKPTRRRSLFNYTENIRVYPAFLAISNFLSDKFHPFSLVSRRPTRPCRQVFLIHFRRRKFLSHCSTMPQRIDKLQIVDYVDLLDCGLFFLSFCRSDSRSYSRKRERERETCRNGGRKVASG